MNRFQVKDEVHYMDNNVPIKSEVKEVHIKMTAFGTSIKYLLLFNTKLMDEKHLFKSKEELFEFLMN